MYDGKDVKKPQGGTAEATPTTDTKTNDAAAKPAAKTKPVKVIEIPKDTTDSNIVELSQTYRFEGKEFDRIDLRKLNDLTGKDLQKIEKLYRKIADSLSAQPERTTDYAAAAASYITGYDAEFLLYLSGKDLTKITACVTSALRDDETEGAEDDNVIVLSKPHCFDGTEVTNLDMRGITDINGKQLQKIKRVYNRITDSISQTPEITVDYAVATAHIVTDFATDELLSLPAKDIYKIRDRVIVFLYGKED